MWAEFTYDAYGLPQLHVPGAPDNTIAQAVQASIGLMLTPQLYRGYVYAAVGDMYTYYLGSRYYVPQLCRFFNADKHSDTQTGVLATNMFAYCNNNPVMHVDPNGEALTMNKIMKLLSNFVILIKNIFSSTVEKNAKGSENNPHKITPGQTVTVYDDICWFYSEVRGATDFILSISAKNATVVIYEKKTGRKEQLYCSNSTDLSYIAMKSNSHKYLVYVSASGKADISCTIKQHIDTMSSSTGGKWFGGNGPFPYLDSNIIYHEKIFYDKEHVGMIADYLDHEKFLDIYTKSLNGTLAVIDLVTSFTIPEAKAVKLFGAIMGLTGILCISIDFRESLKEDIYELCEYDEKTKLYKKGIVLTKKSLEGIFTYDCEVWEGPIMYGKEGYVGRWEIF